MGAKHTWRCREQRCARGSWPETNLEIALRASLTERARREICRPSQDFDTVEELAREFGVGCFCADHVRWSITAAGPSLTTAFSSTHRAGC